MTPEGPGSGKCHHAGKHGDVQEQAMMEQVLAAENLRKAWARVKANAGAPGIDGMTVEAFPAFCRKHWPRIRSALMEGTYRPAPVRRVFIPKPDGRQRPLGVPTVLDRRNSNAAGIGLPAMPTISSSWSRARRRRSG